MTCRAVSVSERLGHRGYIASRPIRGERVPQHVQNLVIRSYCQRNGFTFLLSATEYAMPGCFIMLNEVLRELPRLRGIVLYSLFMLPDDQKRRRALCETVLAAGVSLHGAVEDLALTGPADLERIEDLWLVTRVLRQSADPALILDR